jgi:hypothetical protein
MQLAFSLIAFVNIFSLHLAAIHPQLVHVAQMPAACPAGALGAVCTKGDTALTDIKNLLVQWGLTGAGVAFALGAAWYAIARHNTKQREYASMAMVGSLVGLFLIGISALILTAVTALSA